MAAASPIKITEAVFEDPHANSSGDEAATTTTTLSPHSSHPDQAFVAVIQGNLNKLRAVSGHLNISDVRVTEGWSLVLEAVHRRRVEVLKYLVSKGCDINQGDDFGHTPLWWAASDR